MNLKLEYDSFQDFAGRLWPCLCEEGMWIRSDTAAGVGELVDFDAVLADGFRLFHGTAQVIAVGPGPEGPSGGHGMTLRFGQLDQPSRNLIRKVVSKYVGQGGQLYVLSTPGTKIEVVGGEEHTELTDRATGVVAGMVPEDPSAPFPDLESGSEWSDSAEPELTSFLRPSGKAADGDLAGVEPEPVPAFDLKTDSAPPDEPEALVDEFPAEGPTTPGAPVVDTPMADPPDFGIFEYATPGFDSSEILESTEGEVPESPEPTSGQPGTDFEQSLTETQAVDLLTSDESAEPAPILFSPEVPKVEPLPSIALSPQGVGTDFGQSYEGSELHPDAAIDEPEITSGGRLGWLYLFVAVLAVGSAVFIATQFDTPLSGLFGGETDTEGAADTARVTTSEGADAGLVEVAGPPVGAEGSGGSGDETTTAGVEGGPVTDSAAPVDSAVQSSAAPEAVADGESPALDPPPASPRPSRPSAAVTVPPAEVSPTPIEEMQSASASLDDFRLERVTWWTVEGDTVVRLWLDGEVGAERLESFRVVTGAPRFVVKLTGIAGPIPRNAVPIGSPHVVQLRFGVHRSSDGRQLHAVVDLTSGEVELVGTVAADEAGLELRFTRP
ncbi:MAG: hypothetical protein O7A98_04905 [Acidobacteria bacterium]|nr:hypothetical protein [Acidobacteriota bacterium]